MTEKMTYKKALDYAIQNLPDAPEDVTERLTALAASLEKKATERKKPAAQVEQDEKDKTAILDYLRSLPDTEKRTITDLIKEVDAISGYSTPKVTSLVGGLIESGNVVKVVEKRRSYFKAA